MKRRKNSNYSQFHLIRNEIKRWHFLQMHFFHTICWEKLGLVQNCQFLQKMLSKPCLQGALVAWLVGNQNQAASADHEINVGALTVFRRVATLLCWYTEVNGRQKFWFIFFFKDFLKLFLGPIDFSNILNVGLHEFCDN